MITKIEFIKDFGIYKNFTWNSNPKIKDFNLKNLFYGWNYSGKTTLARVFSSLRDKKLHQSYSKGLFKIQTTHGEFSSSNLETFPYDVLVFNSDYIKDNLRFSFHEDSSSEFNTIFFEVGDNAKYEGAIIDLKNLIESINGSETKVGKKSKFLNDVKEFESYDHPNIGRFTVLAREIKDDHFISLINFTKAHLKSIVLAVKNNIDDHIIVNKRNLAALSEVVKVSEPKEELQLISIDISYDEIIEKVNNVLITEPEKEIVYKILDGDHDAYTWVKEGQKLNKANSKCLFCDNFIDDARIQFLNQYYNSQASNLIQRTGQVKQLIVKERDSIDSANLPSSMNDLNLGFVAQYLVLKKHYDRNVLKYKKHLDYLLQKIDNKISKSLYSGVKNITPFNIRSLRDSIVQINNLIKENNAFSADFKNKINAERNKFKNHLVCSFLKREKYLAKERKCDKANEQLDKLDKQVELLEKEIKRYEALKESDREGAEQYTYFIQSFLNRTDIEIKLDEITKKFVLMRDGNNASNLSEGEKTAIAFSHFLVTIKSLVSKQRFKDFIVFIDDPVSSLDGNHIFQINSMFKDVFFNQVSDSDNPTQLMWNMTCKQLFISTHNFDFFNLMKELPKRNGFDYIKDVRKCKESRYYIDRKIDQSSIVSIPSVFDDYKSEYHFLFNEIVKFNNDLNKSGSNHLLIMPNILRRFVEMYTLAKYPSKDELDDRADKVFGKLISKRILKPLHYFSHFNNIDRIGRHNDLIADLPVACEELLKYLATDKTHFEALQKSIV